MLIRIFNNLFRTKPKQSFTDFSFLKIDIHSHLIPGIDDGAKDMENTMELLRGMQDLGFSQVITTPHVLMEYYPNTTKTIAKGGNEVKAALSESPLDISLNYAAEYFLDEHLEALIKKEDLLTFGDKYLLFELSFFEAPPQLREVIFNLKIKGYSPILAHAERYGYWGKDLVKFRELVEAGCSLQLNLLSIIGHYGPEVKRVAKALIKEKLYDFAGTDVHRMEHIDKLKKGLENEDFGVLSGYEFKNTMLPQP